jgi:hypothetical protein
MATRRQIAWRKKFGQLSKAGKLKKSRHKNPSSGIRIVYNKLLGGWYVVRGPHQTPLNGRFNSKYEAEEWLRRKNPLTVSGVRKGIKTAVRRTKSAIQTGRNAFQRGRNALKAARDLYHALHPGKPLPPSLASKKTKRQRNPRRRHNESYWVEMRGKDNSLIAIGRVFSQKKNAVRNARHAAIGFEGKVYVACGTPSEFAVRLKRLGS